MSKTVADAIIVQWLGKDSRGSFILKRIQAVSDLLLEMCFRLACCKHEETLNRAFF